MIILFGVAMKKSIFFNPTAVYFLLEFLLQQFRLAALSQSSPLVCFPCLHLFRWCSTLFLLTRFSILRVQLPPAVFVPTRAWWGFSFARIQAGPRQGTPLPAVAAGCLLSFSAASGLRSSV
jgi:hypothetical protein